MKKIKFNQAYMILLLPLSLLLIFIASQNPEWIEINYSQNIYKILSQGIASAVGVIPFSLSEWIICVIAILVIFSIFGFIARLVANREDRRYETIRFIVNTSVAISVIVFVFTITCGLNYYRKPVAENFGISTENLSDDSLIKVTEELILEANNYSKLVARDSETGMLIPQNDNALRTNTSYAYTRQYLSYPYLDGLYPTAKPVLFSKIMSSFNITGFFFPFTFEANYNNDISAFEKPFVICHELAHMRGYMRENEANFISFVICTGSDNPEIAYSGTMMGLSYCLDALYTSHPEKYTEIASRINDEVRTDFNLKNEYWKNYDSVAATVGNAVNDTYLKANNQESGINSYNEVVDMIVAYKEKIRE